MATDILRKFDCFAGDMGKKLHNLSTDTIKAYLTNTLPVRTNTVYNTPVDLATANGYTNGGVSITATYTGASGVWTLGMTTFTVTAAGGNIGPFRYVVFYNFTAAAKNLIGWLDYGANLTVADTQTFALPTGAVLTVT